jgi:hypothetical protein
MCIVKDDCEEVNSAPNTKNHAYQYGGGSFREPKTNESDKKS